MRFTCCRKDHPESTEHASNLVLHERTKHIEIELRYINRKDALGRPSHYTLAISTQMISQLIFLQKGRDHKISYYKRMAEVVTVVFVEPDKKFVDNHLYMSLFNAQVELVAFLNLYENLVRGLSSNEFATMLYVHDNEI
ncbi:hypothetical protein CR513_01536, partial [Mucuna pruriens]